VNVLPKSNIGFKVHLALVSEEDSIFADERKFNQPDKLIPLGEIKTYIHHIKWQSFFFSLPIPENALPSFCFGHGQSIMKVKHSLIVLCEQNDDKVKEFEGKPLLKHMRGAEKPLIVIRNDARVPDQPFVVNMKADIKHGLFSQKQSSFTFTFNKKDYAFGENIKMQIDCDNSASSIGVW